MKSYIINKIVSTLIACMTLTTDVYVNEQQNDVIKNFQEKYITNAFTITTIPERDDEEDKNGKKTIRVCTSPFYEKKIDKETKQTEETFEQQETILETQPTMSVEEEFYAAINSISATNTYEWYLNYRSITTQYKQALPHLCQSIYDVFSTAELDLLFHVVQAEIGDEWTFENKVNVASVIFNRVDDSRFEPTLGGVLNPSQFSSISDGRYMQVSVSDITILACEYAYLFRSNQCLFFDSNGVLATSYKWVFNDGAHNFYMCY